MPKAGSKSQKPIAAHLPFCGCADGFEGSLNAAAVRENAHNVVIGGKTMYTNGRWMKRPQA